MKRGKSTFIKALLGADVLPTGFLPVTAIITEIKYGQSRKQ
jgi:ribosome biogenesis GTPase A